MVWETVASKTKILVIESEPGVLMMMVRQLTQAGCYVKAAWNAETRSGKGACGRIST